VAAGFVQDRIEALATVHKNAAFSGLLQAHETQRIGVRAFTAVADWVYGRHGKPRFKGRRGLHSVEGKSNAACIRWREGHVNWNGLELVAIVDTKDDWLAEALAARTKYCRILRRTLRGRERWFVQLVQEGRSPVKPKHQAQRRTGTVGLDIGPSTIAIVGEDEAKLVRFCDTIEQPWRAVRRTLRAMDRSRRATNPDNYNEDGTIRRGPKTWRKSNRYRRLARQYAELERRLAGERKRAHGELANEVLALGDKIKTEKLSYRSLQKNFGRSVKVRAPGTFVSMLRRKAESAGGELEDIPTRTTKLSQFCHGCGSFTKKPLSLRTHACACGIGPVQRDLYSAFLARFVREGELDATEASKAWARAEPLLRRAASSANQPASGPDSVRSQVRASERVACQVQEEPSRPRMSYGSVPEGRGETLPLPFGTPGL
jgi:hypothetical protein